MSPTPVEITERLAESVASFECSEPVTHIYHPLQYAKPLHDAYLRRYGEKTPREILMVGMNPGPWGMAQTGVPFGDVDFVGEWMGLDAEVGRPEDEHPKRPVEGLDCGRNEVSGSRLWGWARERYGAPETFFERFFVYNYCPLLFLEASGRNRTPNRLKAAERRALFPPCDEALRQMVAYYRPRFVVGVGAFATRRIEAAVGDVEGGEFVIGRILHPSPASPKANRGWAEQAEAEFRELGVDL